MHQFGCKKQAHVYPRMVQTFMLNVFSPHRVFTNHQFEDVPLTLAIGIVEQHTMHFPARLKKTRTWTDAHNFRVKNYFWVIQHSEVCFAGYKWQGS